MCFLKFKIDLCLFESIFKIKNPHNIIKNNVHERIILKSSGESIFWILIIKNEVETKIALENTAEKSEPVLIAIKLIMILRIKVYPESKKL